MKILVAQTAFLGDVVLTLPLIRALREIYPESRISVLATPEGAEALKADSSALIDEFIIDEKRTKFFGSTFGIFRTLRKNNFDLAVGAHRSGRTALLLGISGAGLRVGFKTSPLSFLYHKRVRDDLKIHAARRYLLLTEALGKVSQNFDPKPRLEISPKLTERADALVKEFSAGRKIALLCHGSVWETKRWTTEGFASLAESIHEKLNMAVVLAGAKSETGRAEHIRKTSKAPVLDLTGKTTIGEFAGLCAKSSLVVANDSGTMHIASALGRPLVAVFGPTVTEMGFTPLNENSAVAEVKELYCRPCGRHGAKKCPEKHFRCMKELSAESVFEVVKKIVGN